MSSDMQLDFGNSSLFYVMFCHCPELESPEFFALEEVMEIVTGQPLRKIIQTRASWKTACSDPVLPISAGRCLFNPIPS